MFRLSCSMDEAYSWSTTRGWLPSTWLFFLPSLSLKLLLEQIVFFYYYSFTSAIIFTMLSFLLFLRPPFSSFDVLDLSSWPPAHTLPPPSYFLLVPASPPPSAGQRPSLNSWGGRRSKSYRQFLSSPRLPSQLPLLVSAFELRVQL